MKLSRQVNREPKSLGDLFRRLGKEFHRTRECFSNSEVNDKTQSKQRLTSEMIRNRFGTTDDSGPVDCFCIYTPFALENVRASLVFYASAPLEDMVLRADELDAALAVADDTGGRRHSRCGKPNAFFRETFASVKPWTRVTCALRQTQ